MDKSLLRHPEVIEHFREILVSGVRHKSHNAFAFLLLPAITKRARHKSSGGRTSENPFLPQQFTRGRETFLIVVFKCIRDDEHVSYFPNKIFPNSFTSPTSRLIHSPT